MSAQPAASDGLFDADEVIHGEIIEDAPEAKAPGKGLVIPKATLKLLDYASRQELESIRKDIGYSARVWAQVSLPYKDPGNIPYWHRRNGAVSLLMEPATLERRDGTIEQVFPFGLLPRDILTFFSTEAVRTMDPVLVLGSSMNAFMLKLGLAKGGRDSKRLTEQLERLLAAHLTVTGIAEYSNGHGREKNSLRISDQSQLWFGKDDTLMTENEGLWSSTITLTDAFFNSIVKRPVPIDLGAMHALGSSPLKRDIYVWATHHVFAMDKIQRIKWEDLNVQFGGQYAEDRQFKAAFIKAVRAVQIVYPDLNIEITPTHLVLKPSRPHVPMTKPRRIELI